MKYYYSIKAQGFYPEDMLEAYKKAGSLPDDLLEMSEKDYLAFFNPPSGYGGFFDEKGPRVEKLPEPDYLSIAENQRQILLSEVAPAISVWQTKLMLGRKLTDEETASLNAWIDYSDVLNDTDISDAPDVQWPTKPTE